jgi:hypothetical protein
MNYHHNNKEFAMNKTSKISASLLSLLFCVFLIWSRSQTQPGQPQQPSMLPDSSQIVQMVDELAKAVSLSEQQKEKVLKFHLEHFNQAKNMMEKEQKHHEEMRKVHDEFREKFEKQIKALLNDKQQAGFEEFLKMQHERRDRRQHRPPR